MNQITHTTRIKYLAIGIIIAYFGSYAYELWQKNQEEPILA